MARKGNNNRAKKISDEKKQAIVQTYIDAIAEGQPIRQKDLAQQYGITQATVSNILNDAEVVRSTRRRQGVNVVMAQAILERAAVKVAQKTVESALKDRDEKYEYITQMDRRDVLDRAGVRARDESSGEISITFASGAGVSVGMPQGTQDEDAAQGTGDSQTPDGRGDAQEWDEA